MAEWPAPPVATVSVPVRAPATRAEALRQCLADEIVSGQRAPGTPLDEQELARRFGVSRTPVREAIRELAASGLVQVRPHRGAVVALPDPRELVDMFQAMAELEALCAGLAAERMKAVERRALLALHEALRLCVQDGEPLAYHAANERFHAAIYAGSGNGYLAGITLATRARVAPFRKAQFQLVGRLAGSWREHELIVQAILRGDRLAASDAMRQHIDIVRDAFRDYAGLG